MPLPGFTAQKSEKRPSQTSSGNSDFEYFDTPEIEQIEPTLNDEILETTVTIADEARGQLDVIKMSLKFPEKALYRLD